MHAVACLFISRALHSSWQACAVLTEAVKASRQRRAALARKACKAQKQGAVQRKGSALQWLWHSL